MNIQSIIDSFEVAYEMDNEIAIEFLIEDLLYYVDPELSLLWVKCISNL